MVTVTIISGELQQDVFTAWRVPARRELGVDAQAVGPARRAARPFFRMNSITLPLSSGGS